MGNEHVPSSEYQFNRKMYVYTHCWANTDCFMTHFLLKILSLYSNLLEYIIEKQNCTFYMDRIKYEFKPKNGKHAVVLETFCDGSTNKFNSSCLLCKEKLKNLSASSYIVDQKHSLSLSCSRPKYFAKK